MKIFLLISLIYIFISLPSDDIWNKTLSYIEQGKMLIDEKKSHFIFDESNYTQLDIHNPKMQILFEKQGKLFKKHNISNYIFVVDNLNEKEETIENATFNLCKYLYNVYGINMEKSVVALFSIKSRRFRIRTGEKVKYRIENEDLDLITSHLIPYLKFKRYFRAWIRYVDEIYNYYTYNSLFVVIIIIIILILIYIFASIYEKRKKIIYLKWIKKDKIFKKIVSFLKKQKTNKTILSDNCAICLEAFTHNNAENQNNKEIDQEQKDFSDSQNKINVKSDITTLECGHQYHCDCRAKWMERKNECPLCRQKIKYNSNREDAQLVWEVQNDLYDNRYSNIEYNDLFYFDILYRILTGLYMSIIRIDSHGDNSRNYSFSGGRDNGGGVTGGW